MWMSTVPRRTRSRAGRQAPRLLGGAPAADSRPRATWMSASARAPEDVRDVVDGLELDHAAAYDASAGSRSPVDQAASPPGRARRRAPGGRPRARSRARWANRTVAARRPHQRQTGPVDGDVGRQPEVLVLVHDDHAGRGAVRTVGGDPASVPRRPAAPDPSKLPVDILAPARLFTGRPDAQHLGGSSRASRGACLSPVPARGRHLQLDQVRRRPKSPPDIACRIASPRSPFCSNHSLARRCRPATSGLLVEQPRAEDVGEEVVVAVPPTVVVERDDEEVVALERLQHRPPAVLAGHGVAQGAVQTLQHRGPQQERLDVRGWRCSTSSTR